MAPTESEGLHMPPAEAMMTECPVVGTNAPLSGIQDYLEDKKTGVITENNIDSFIDGVLSLYHNREYSLELGKHALNKIKELGDRKENMKRMIKLFEEQK
jgi:glycosyltransferase involved in cell wall biosynthesis